MFMPEKLGICAWRQHWLTPSGGDHDSLLNPNTTFLTHYEAFNSYTRLFVENTNHEQATIATKRRLIGKGFSAAQTPY
jgi:hypothetical protein